MPFKSQVDGNPVVTQDEGYQRNYSAKRKVVTKFQHQKAFPFTHTHEDGKDYEDSYRYETMTIGDIEIQYIYDWGNYFIREYIIISKSGKEVAYVEQTQGAVDPLKTETREHQKGLEILQELAGRFEMTVKEFMDDCSSTCKMNMQCLKLFLVP